MVKINLLLILNVYYIRMHILVGIDYANSTLRNVTIFAGSTSSPFTIDIIDDMIQEDNETFNIAITFFPSCLSLKNGTVQSTVIIIDREGKFVRS